LEAGLSLIQVLPVNDTGTLSSPYSAVSAFALHPVYIRLQDVPGAEELTGEIDAFRSSAEARQRVDHEKVLGFKLGILYRIYRRTLDDKLDLELDTWIDQNEWVRTYSVYKCLKDRYEQKSWVDWPEFRDPTQDDLARLWTELEDFARFYAWVQMHLDHQFRRAADALRKQGVYLKGDIPILMNVDSADVWTYRNFFDLNFGAGAPPDVFSRTGQTWGFPIYRWDELQADGYSWWRYRLQVAANYYDVFRIDHVLGFFRIWSQSADELTAVLGHYEPSPSITTKMMEDSGLPGAAIEILIRAWTTKSRAVEAIGHDADRILDTYFSSGNGLTSEDMTDPPSFLNDDIAGERLIEDLDESDEVKNFLIECHRDRSFVPAGPDAYYPAWYRDESKGLEVLSKKQTDWFNQLVSSQEEKATPIWMELGRKSLTAVCEATDMLACAEDLGSVPDGLPEVLQSIGILSLKIERWEVDDEGRLLDPSDFPYLSVSTPSVHDLSTLRVWWEENNERDTYFDALDVDGECPSYLTTEVAAAVIERNLRSNSAIVVFQIQDLFALVYDLRMDPPESERINVPGTIGDHNWSYRMPVTIEALKEHEIGTSISELISEHRDAGQTTEAR